MSEQERVYCKRPDGTRGTAILGECQWWPLARWSFVLGPDAGTATVEDIDQVYGTPYLFRTPGGEYFHRRRFGGDAESPMGLRREVPVYLGVTREQARAWLREQRYDLPDDLVEKPDDEGDQPEVDASTNTPSPDEALQATIDAIDDGRSEKAVPLIRLIAEAPGRRLETDEALRTLYAVGPKDRRAMEAARRTGMQLIRRVAERLDSIDDVGTPLRLAWTPKVLRLIDRDLSGPAAPNS